MEPAEGRLPALTILSLLHFPGGTHHLQRGSLRVPLPLWSHETVPTECHTAAALQTGAQPPPGPVPGP